MESNAARVSLAAVVGVVPVALVMMTASPAVAVAESAGLIADQPGVFTGPAQPGTSAPTLPPPPDAEPEPQAELLSPQPPVFYAQPPQVRNDSSSRPAPEFAAPVAPFKIEDLHLPEPVEPVAPIEAPPDTVRVGQWSAPRPDWLPPECAEAINDAAAQAEAQVATALDSIGIEAGRSDRVAGATLAGAGIGGAAGAVVAGVPAAAAGAVVGGLVGGTIGGIAGAAVGTVISVPVVGPVTSGVAGTVLGAAAGAAAGAAVAGLPVAAVGAVAAGTVGAGFGAGVGVGQP
ncbi:hypothetical protein [Nocardia takedensis]|uniref:hypothetical protein n=1 Tax=Nocardia takedensis TaxID=259390 RepID=UPI0012F6A034|nr:hypothetical protein [Nocardia takedensis]